MFGGSEFENWNENLKSEDAGYGGFRGSSSSVDWLGREMLEMRLRDHEDDRVSTLINLPFL